ncbi:MAG: sigma-54 dependent transcriptional regulator [Mariprofundales bacterium]|nr:sigma-54 dependent transcriptional regulator [Mariprofundales bacterium]
MKALVIDDDAGIRWILERVLREEGVEVLQAETLADGRAMAESYAPNLIFLDLFLPDGNGMDALGEGVFGEIPVVILTAQTTFDHAAQAYRQGAMEYLPKPFDINEVRALANRVRPLSEPVVAPALKAPREVPRKEMIIGQSTTMQQLFRTLGRVAASDLTVLITGESGTGKEVVARVLHDESRRVKRAFVAINTAAIPADLLETELFGHEKGAFTGADKQRKGLFEQADGGTLFLDEIGDMPLPLQAKLLRVLESGTIQRIGSGSEHAVDVRLLAATHCDLQQRIEDGRFRQDLYYRLNVIPVQIPPLRERRDDIPRLAERFLEDAAAELQLDAPILLGDAVAALCRYDWRGNVRELKNVMRRLAVLTPGPSITPNDVALALGGVNHGAAQQKDRLEDAVTRVMKRYIEHLGTSQPNDLYRTLLAQVEPPLLNLVLELSGGNQGMAANMLGLNRNTVRKLLKQYNIDSFSFRR